MFETSVTFIEESVKSKETAFDRAKKMVCILGTVIFLLGSLFTAGAFRIVAFILFIVFAVLTYLVMGYKNIEYEYDYTNGSLDIAKIINNEKRKNIVTVESSEIKMVAAEGTNESLKYDNVQLKTYDCSARDDSVKSYILVGHNEAKGSDYKVIFSPSGELIEAMKKYNKRDIYE